ncbi:MAG: phosphotransferase [Planctomycetes bacterium]|nr:phosphotransferase [Planctomycetota bacterium]
MVTVARRHARIGERPWGARFERINADWLTGLLHEKDALNKDDKVKSFELERFGEIGQMSAVYRINLTYESGILGPQTLVLKTTMPEVKNRLLNKVFDVFSKEIRSYALPDPTSGLLRPRCWYATEHTLSGSAFLILDDLGHWRGSPALERVTLNDAERIVLALANHHASWWDKPELQTLAFQTTSQNLAEVLGPMCVMSWKKARQVMNSLVDKEVMQVLDQYMENQQAISDHLIAGPKTLIHGDLNSNNIFIEDISGQVCAIDWQSTHIGNWAEDIAYFLVMGLQEKDYATHGSRLVTLYRDELKRQGVEMNDDDFSRDYALGVLQAISLLIVAAQIIDEKKDPLLYKFFHETIQGWAAAKPENLVNVMAEICQ